MTKTQVGLRNLEKNQYAYYFAQDAVNDYISSRILFESGMFLNSLQLCATSIEKLFKSIGNLVKPESDHCATHDLVKLHRRYIEEIKRFELVPNLEFLQWLTDLYKTRYTSSVYGRASFDFLERHLLAEIDYLFHQFFSCFEKGKNFSKLYFDNPKIEHCHSLNHLISGEAKSEYVKKSQRMFSILFIGNSPKVTIVSLRSCGRVDGFSRGASVVEDEDISVNINVGTLSPIDLPPSYYSRI